MNGKGDKPRPLSISYSEYADRWDKIFGKKDDGFYPEKTDKKTIEILKKFSSIKDLSNESDSIISEKNI